MPRRRHGRSVRSIRSTVTNPSDPRYYRLLGAHNHAKNIRRMMGMAVNELKKKGELDVGEIIKVSGDSVKRSTFYSGKGTTEFGRRLDQLKRDADVAERKLYEDPLDSVEKSGITRLLSTHISPIVRKKNVYIEYEREGKKVMNRLDQDILHVKTPYDLYDLSRAVQEVIEAEKKRNIPTKWLEDLNSDLLRIAATAIIQRDFQAFGWKDPADSIFRAVKQETPLPLDPIYFSDNLDTIRKRVERTLARTHKSERKRLEDERNHRVTRLRGPLQNTPPKSKRTGGPLSRLMKILSPFEMPRAKRKEIYRDFSQTVLDKYEEGKTGRTKRPVSVVSRYKGVARHHVNRAFKASRLSVREKLTNIGMNPDDVLNRLDLLNGGPGNTYSTAMMRRLNVLSGLMREKRTPIEAREAILDVIMRYQETKIPKSQTPAPRAPIEHPTPSVPNPRKLTAREERRRRKRELDEQARNARSVTPRTRSPVPSSLPEMVQYLNSASTVTHEDVIALRRMVKSVKITSTNRALILAGMRHLLLAERATFGLHGRLEERALRNRALPQNRYGEFPTVLQGLMQEGVFEYAQHGNRNDFIKLAGPNPMAIIAKYGHKKNQSIL